MKPLKYCLLLVLILGNSKAICQTLHEVSLPLTSKIEMKSNYGAEYSVYISLPAEYLNSDKTYPVIYTMDGDLTFGIVYNSRVLMSFGREIPEVILVGLAYKEGFENIHSNRLRDLTPTKWPEVQIEKFTGISGIENSGGADNFLNFLEDCVKKYINDNYRANKNDETLVGYSLSGLFATYVASKKEPYFNKYLIASPSLWWFGSSLPVFSDTNKGLPMYWSVGSQENQETMVKPWKKLTSELKSVGFLINPEILADEGHVTAFNSAFHRGIKYLFGMD
ncbi:hypothetical protein DKG77_06280 [Flagellimonas aquimarina]|uniref:Alpha/beta hydrolase n=2 Tax=Flagellimonas aquimarina TaxID=2201895 RepID=A0A316L4T0_9FLAO|nr:hypothetical protein DKG77_06280 [Allomuricauda koreensis]